MGGAEGGGPRQPPTLQPTDTPGEGLARGDEWGNRQWAPPLTPFLNLSSKHPHSALRSRRWKKFCLLLSPSFCVQAVYGRRWWGGFADAGGGGVARQLWKLPFHSHKALPGGGVCSKAAECYPLTSSPTAPVAPIYGQLFQPSPGSNPDTRQRIWSALNLNPPAL